MFLCYLVCWAWTKCLSKGSSWLTSCTLQVNGLSKHSSSSKQPATWWEHHPEQAPACPETQTLISFILLDTVLHEMNIGNKMGEGDACYTSALLNNTSCCGLGGWEEQKRLNSSSFLKKINSRLFPTTSNIWIQGPVKTHPLVSIHQSMANSLLVLILLLSL